MSRTATALDELYVALQTFCCNHEGQPLTIAAGQRLRGGPGSIPERFSTWFALDGSDSLEVARRQASLMEATLPLEEPVPQPAARPPKMRAVRNAIVGHAAVMAGDLFRPDDEVVRAAPENFVEV